MKHSKLSEQALEAYHRIKALRKLPDGPSKTRAELGLLESITLREVCDVAVALSENERQDEVSHA